MTPPLEVDVPALEAIARQLGGRSDELTSGGVTHDCQPPAAQATGPAAVGVTAAANHVVGEAAASLLSFADDVAGAARYYAARDSDAALKIGTTMQPPR